MDSCHTQINFYHKLVRLWLNDNAMFDKTLIEKNNKEIIIIAHLRDKHSECCIFNIVQHQTFVNKD